MRWAHLGKAIDGGEEDEADEMARSEEAPDQDQEDKWVKSRSIAPAHKVPIELPLEAPEGYIEEPDEDDIIVGLEAGKLQILQIPPFAFGGNFLEEQDVDEQEVESLEVNLGYLGAEFSR